MLFSSFLFAVAAVTPALAFPQYAPELVARQSTGGSIEGWARPGPNDARGPCPGMNTLANHGYLPRDGRKITLARLTAAMKEGYNINSGDARLLFSQAVRTNPAYPRSRDTFDLDTLGREGVLEHDISLSRSDRFFANPLPFNATVWAETFSYFKTDMITVEQLAQARQARYATSIKTNPQHKLSALGSGFSWGECASFFEIMADGTTGTVDKKYIDYWFRNERLPTEIGWKRRTTEMQGSEREKYTQVLQDAGAKYAPAGTGSGSSRPGLGGLGGLGGLFGRSDEGIRFVH
ncbi:sterigmatocystin biosynthesis peroxidase-like protein 1 [Elsinoe australis]|uniref:Sterigmatocystin biosynthesis peroxidase-like protein 1 n=1 Tax=Elsinoe australis TaxID=40998 RepID=A0A4U7B7U1_9PEZI|nr:sterigmatocystin biosynthesis peroxidase-like protein 1 [Elsinoe australis]